MSFNSSSKHCPTWQNPSYSPVVFTSPNGSSICHNLFNEDTNLRMDQNRVSAGDRSWLASRFGSSAIESMVNEASREYREEGEGRVRMDTARDIIADAQVRANQLLDDATVQVDSLPADEASEIIAEATIRARQIMSDAESRGDRCMAETYARAGQSVAESIFSAAAVLCPDMRCVGRHVHLSQHDFSLLEALVARNPTRNPSWISEQIGICPEAGKRFQVVGSSALSHDGLGWSR